MLEPFGAMPGGEPVHRVTLDNDTLRVRLLTFGAAIQSLEVPGAQGRTNVVLGFDTLEDYVARSPHFGAIPGRYAGRIANGRFTLDGAEYRLPRNDGSNTLHGGPAGFGKRPWTLADHGPHHATLTLLSPDGDAGFPGELHVTARYTLEGPALRMDLAATTTRPTVLNLTNHSYFNLAGEGSGTALDHTLTIDARHILPTNPDGIPTGERRPVDGTPFDFRTPHPIGARIRADDPQLLQALGYDIDYLLEGAGLRRAALLQAGGHTLTVLTTQPALRLYTANKLTGALVGPSARAYRQSDAVCLETQHPGDSPNHPAFPSTTLRPGAPFAATTVYRFGQ